MHPTAPFSLMPVAMTNHSIIIEAPDDACGYLNGLERSRFGCHENSEKCAIYYPSSSVAATTAIDATVLPMITPAPQPSIICCVPSGGDCTVQPTACVDSVEDCIGISSSDPMTLKCTTGAHRHCNRAHFESPLQFRDIEALDAGMRLTDAPADGWFCGPSAIPIGHADTSHSKSASMTHMSHHSTSQYTTLSVTITLSKPGLEPRPPYIPLPTGAVAPTDTAPGDVDCTDESAGSDDYDCCTDEPSTPEPCCNDAHRGRLRRRQAIDGSTTTALPAAAPGEPITRGSAIVSTAYIGQTDRAPFVEATRPWNVIIPTAVANFSKNTTGPRLRPLPPKKKSQLSKRAKVAIGVSVSLLALIAIGCKLWKKYGRPPAPSQPNSEHELNESQVDISGRTTRYEDFTRMKRRVANLSRPHDILDFGDVQGQPSAAFERQQHISPESGAAADDESAEMEAYVNMMGIGSATYEERNTV
ncbi:hypothetical protein J7T55_006808 [Diaporthe amygdali]|uniref:uncharacterized protein n=1 Tax=Phomopsis amygdali TaxID=1214568 RepID=UPI0022FDB11C|nr:uncharacterized protein J7T55_006808 [Diaporthe amygdali]KAJ0125462.1 hypothetical protein J7T55_006808 [Diaporthe amygdali]